MRFLAPAAAALLAFQIAPGMAQNLAPANPQAPANATATPTATQVQPASPAATQAAPAAPMSPATMPAAKRHARMSLQQRFEAANTTNDGHLTRDQADAAKWSYVSHHFESIDKDHKGYVTVADIQAYSHASRAARHHTTKSAAPQSAPSTTAPAAPAPATPPAPSGSSGSSE